MAFNLIFCLSISRRASHSLGATTVRRAGLPDAVSKPGFPSLSTAALTRHNSVAATSSPESAHDERNPRLGRDRREILYSAPIGRFILRPQSTQCRSIARFTAAPKSSRAPRWPGTRNGSARARSPPHRWRRASRRRKSDWRGPCVLRRSARE
jgi:hypothetical protein